MSKRPKQYTTQIIKLQRPLATNMDQAQVLVYNEDRSLERMLPYTDDMQKLFGSDQKQYWLADIPKKTGYIKLIQQVEEQDW